MQAILCRAFRLKVTHSCNKILINPERTGLLINMNQNGGIKLNLSGI